MDKKTLFMILEKTIAQTRADVIPWRATPPGANDYKVDFNHSSLYVWHQKDEYGFSIINSNGISIGELITSQINDQNKKEKIKNLFEIVHKSAMQIDETIKDALEGLEGRSIPEETPF